MWRKSSTSCWSRGRGVPPLWIKPRLALELAHRGYVMESGNITLADEANKLLADPKVREAYLGESAG